MLLHVLAQGVYGSLCMCSRVGFVRGFSKSLLVGILATLANSGKVLLMSRSNLQQEQRSKLMQIVYFLFLYFCPGVMLPSLQYTGCDRGDGGSVCFKNAQMLVCLKTKDMH